LRGELRIPTIGIGAGPDCDGQILVVHDLLGLTFDQTPKFARKYANVGEIISNAVRGYCEDVRNGSFPSDNESYHSGKTVKDDKAVRISIC
jgi:3-methyl-2-oxobutanoate hydroxymethyltransferase